MAIPPSSRNFLSHMLSNRTEVGSNEFHAYCFSLAERIDAAIANDEVMADAQDLPTTLNHVCQYRCTDQTRAVIMVLMVSAKSACQLGWFPQRESQELLAIVDSMWKSFSSPEKVASSLNSPVSLIPQVMERFYPFLKLGHVFVSFEAEAESNILLKDFHISKKTLKRTPKSKIGLLVFRTEDVSKASCIIHPQEVSFLLNGKCVDNRYINSTDSGPQRPTNVSALLYPGSNVLQTIGCFGGSYFIVIAILDDIPLPVNPSLKDYVPSEAIESNPDCDIIEGPSRISLSCPISRTRIKLPVKGHVCKHLQCFDFWNYIKINTRIPSWRCPHCNQSVCYTDIRLDQIMIKILEEVGSNAKDVVISADGSWRVVTENDENVEAVPETTYQHGDPNSFQHLGPTVLDLTRDENEMETSGGTQVNEQKPCLSKIPMLNQSSASIDALPQLPQTLNVYDGQQQFMNFPASAARETIHMPFLPTSSQDRIATNTGSFHIPMPAAQSSQFQGSHVSPVGHCQGRTSDLMDRWSRIYATGITQTQLPPMPPPLHHQYAMQNQRLPTRSLSPAQERPIPSSITHHQTFPVNYGGTSAQRHMQVPMQRPGQRLNHGGAAEQFSSRQFMNSTPANTANSRPQIRMRGSLIPGSTRYDHMIIRPTRPVQASAQTLPPPQPTAYNYIPVQAQAQTRPPPQPTVHNYIPVQAQAQTLHPPQPTVHNYTPVQAQAQTLPQPQPTGYYNISDEIQAFLAHPSYPSGTNETQGGIGSLPVAEGVGPPGSFWSMPPETW